MSTPAFNPVGFAINLAIGWFFLSFIQSAVRSLFSGSWTGLVARFKDIAFFHDGRGALVNIIMIVAIGVVTRTLWYLAHRS